MRYIKLYEELKNDNFFIESDIINKILKNKNIINLFLRSNLDQQAHNEEELRFNIKQRLKKFETGNNEIELSRVLFIKNKINNNKLGEHWTNIIVDDEFIDMIAEVNGIDIDDYNIYIIDAIFNKKDINYSETIINNILFPDEYEINIKKDAKPISYEIRKYNDINENIQQSEYVNWNTIDLYELYDELNKLLFNNELPKVIIKKVKKKNIGGQVLYDYNKNTKWWDINCMEISVLFKSTLQSLKNTLAHEMIHIKLKINKVKTFGIHDYHFRDEMDRINKNFNFNIDNKHNDEFLPTEDSLKDIYYMIFKKPNDYSIIVIADNIKDDIIGLFNRVAEMKSKYSTVSLELYKSKNSILKQFTIHRSLKAIKGLYHIENIECEQLINTSELVEKRTYKDGKKVD